MNKHINIKKFKKFFLNKGTFSLILAGSLPLSVVLPLTSLTNQNFKNAPSHSKLLKAYHNRDYFSKSIKELDYEKTSKLAKDNLEIKNWISNLSYENKQNFEQSVHKLNKLNLSNDLKIFMYANLLDKYELIKNKSLKTSLKSQTQGYSYDNNYDHKTSNYYYVLNQNKQPVKNLLDQPIKNLGSDYREINDWAFADDEVYIGWSTEHLYNFGLMTYQDQFKKNLKSLQDLFKHKLGLKNLSENDIKKVFAELMVPVSDSDSKNRAKLLLLGITDYMLAGLSAGFSTFFNTSRALSVAIGISTGSIPVSVANYGLNTDWTSAKKAIINSIGPMISIIAMLIPTPVSLGITALGALVSLVVSVISAINVGNGYNLIENMHDHGLNDWYFQMKNNKENMFQTALSFSDNYKNPIEWKITDGWFTYPELYIRRGQHARSSGHGWRHLSPSILFNFGFRVPRQSY